MEEDINFDNFEHKFPDTPGLYLFHGYRFKSDENDSKVSTFVVEVVKKGIITCEGQFMFESELGTKWYFRKFEWPNDLPLIENQ